MVQLMIGIPVVKSIYVMGGILMLLLLLLQIRLRHHLNIMLLERWWWLLLLLLYYMLGLLGCWDLVVLEAIPYQRLRLLCRNHLGLLLVDMGWG